MVSVKLTVPLHWDAGAAVTVSPAGSASVKPKPDWSGSPGPLVMVRVSEVVAPVMMEDTPKALARVVPVTDRVLGATALARPLTAVMLAELLV